MNGRLKIWLIVLCVILGGFAGFAGKTEGATMFEWDRNVEADIDHYEMYWCKSSSSCIPGTTLSDRLGLDVPQPPEGQKPTMVFPPGKIGRAGVVAVDLVGNKSGLSNIVPFADATPPSNPAGLAVK